MILHHYASNKPLAQRYIEINQIIGFAVTRGWHRHEWFCYEVTGDSTGLPNFFKTKREAKAAAQKCSEITGLPVFKVWPK